MAKGKTSKEVRKLDKIARRNGFELVRSGKHLVYRHPQISEQLVIAKSASDRRAEQNNLARMRRLLRSLET